MSIYLAQHGKSAPKDVDPQRGLTAEGKEEAARVARALERAGILVDVIRHSGKARAAQTADVFAAALNPPGGVEARPGLDPLDDVTAFAAALPKDGAELYVGHLPFMERAVSYLIGGDAEACVVRFHNGGVACLEWDGDAGRWVLDWMIVPDLAGI